MKLFKWLATALLVAAVSTTGSAQTDQGKISGSVRDQSSAIVTDATITVKNERTSETRTAMSNASGLFVVTGLKPAPYTIRVQKTGFSPLEYTSLDLAVGQTLELDF